MTRTVVLALMITLGLGGVGCGAKTSSDAVTTPTVANSGTGSAPSVAATVTVAGASAEDGTSSADRDTALRFADCMRHNGVKAFPDPDASGQLTIDAIANGSSLDTNSAAFAQALDACKDLEPSGFTGHTRNAREQAAALDFAQCIRDNGVTDFPDPAPDDPLVDTNRIPSTERTGGMAVLNTAMRTCTELAAAAGVAGQ